MATFVAKNSGGVKKPMIILKEFIFCFFCVKQQKVPATDEITG